MFTYHTQPSVGLCHHSEMVEVDLNLCYFEPTSIAEVEKGALSDHYDVYCLSVYLPVKVRFNI